MKIAQAYNIFNQLHESVRDVGITDWEFSTLVNTATLLTLKDYFKGGFEMDQFEAERWGPIIVEPGILTTNVDGIISLDTIAASFPNDIVRNEDGIIETRKTPVFHINYLSRYNVATDIFEPAKWYRLNWKSQLIRNPFRSPTSRDPYYTYTDDIIEVRPGGLAQIQMSVTRMPKQVWYSEDDPTTNIDPELPDQTMMDILLRAMQLKGINVGDIPLAQAMKSVEVDANK